MHKLVLLRHGESTWNLANRFTGWTDVDLTSLGVEQARNAGRLLKEGGFEFDRAWTSVLKRAVWTLWHALDAMDRTWLPVSNDWRLNERHYGALQGLDKAATREKYGDEQFMRWRRSYDEPPPPLADDNEWSQAGDPRYANLLEILPRTECLADVVHRMLPYWYDALVPELQAGRAVLVAAHGNSLRAIVKHIDQVSDEAIAKLNIPTGIPLRYDLDADLRPVKPGGEYLDPEAAAAAIEAVKNQGKK
jgi:2,3-bisphosphoglycerate-dependent phosphoglycerate mutase